MDGIRAHDIGAVRPADSLADVLRLFTAAREWSIDADEQLRAEGHQPCGATLGMPISQLDAIIVILERTQAELASAARAQVAAGICVVACGLCVLVNLGVLIARWF